MQKIIIIISVLAMLLLREECHGQGTVKYTAGTSYGFGDPTYTPTGNVSKKYINLTTLRSSTYSGTSWVLDAQGIDVVSGCAAPAYTPGLGQSNIVLNNCTLLQNGQGPELYVFDGTSWIFINEKNTAPTYTAGTGIDITGTVISNTGDLSNTNEIQNLSLSGQTLGISSGNTVTLPVVAVAAGTGISVSNSSGTATVTNIAPDQVVSITGAGINAVTGTYPNFTVTGTEVDGSTTNELQTLSVAGSNLSISGGNTVTLPTPSSTLDGLTDVTITSPAGGQILQYNSAGSQWVNATLSAITGTLVSGRIPYANGVNTVTTSDLFTYTAGSSTFQVPGIGLFGLSATAAHDYVQVTNSNASGNPEIKMFNSGLVDARITAEYKDSGAGFVMSKPLYVTGRIGTTGEFSSIGLNSLGVGVADNQNTPGGALRLRAFVGGKQYISFVEEGVAFRGCFGFLGSGADLIYKHSSTNLTDGTEVFRITNTALSLGTSSPSVAAKLDVTSTTQGVLFPRMTATQRDAIASPPDGLVLYNTTAAKLQVRSASAWVDLH